MKKPVCLILMLSFFTTACATHSSKIQAQYVSPMQYQSYNCNQVATEMERVGRRINEVAGVQDSEATKDAWATGIGLVLFWPALFFLMGDDRKEELSRLKGEFEALEQVAVQKECSDVLQTLEEGRERAQERTE